LILAIFAFCAFLFAQIIYLIDKAIKKHYFLRKLKKISKFFKKSPFLSYFCAKNKKPL